MREDEDVIDSLGNEEVVIRMDSNHEIRNDINNTLFTSGLQNIEGSSFLNENDMPKLDMKKQSSVSTKRIFSR